MIMTLQEKLIDKAKVRYPIHYKSIPHLGIKKDCPIERMGKEYAQRGYVNRMTKYITNRRERQAALSAVKEN